MKCPKPQWRQAAPYVPDPWWYEPLIILRDAAIFLGLIMGVPFLVWLVWGGMQP